MALTKTSSTQHYSTPPHHTSSGHLPHDTTLLPLFPPSPQLALFPACIALHLSLSRPAYPRPAPEIDAGTRRLFVRLCVCLLFPEFLVQHRASATAMQHHRPTYVFQRSLSVFPLFLFCQTCLSAYPQCTKSIIPGVLCVCGGATGRLGPLWARALDGGSCHLAYVFLRASGHGHGLGLHRGPFVSPVGSGCT
jgi:hypothetical protein